MRTSTRFGALRSGVVSIGAAVTLTVTLSAHAAAGGPPNVAIVAAAQASSASPWFTDPQAKLVASGLFGVVDIINATTSTPTLAQLQAYDAVLTWSNQHYLDSVALGDVMADYVDGGGGVVVAVFANSDLSATRALQGRWATGGYSVIVPQGGTTTGMATLGVVHVPAHPIMAGVSTFNGGTSSFRPTMTTLTAGSQVIASWSDGKVLVAAHGSMTGRVDLGFYPTSDVAASTFWVSSTDGGVLMSNALFHVAGSTPSSTAYCSGDGSGTACPCGNSGIAGNGCASSVNANGANLATSGNPSLSADTLVLAGTGMPNSSALYFQGTSQSAGGLGVLFGDGLRCVGGAIVRLKTATNVGGSSQYPQAGEASVSVRGLVAAPGTRTYQVWYRNAASFCTAATFNLSNGAEVAWGS